MACSVLEPLVDDKLPRSERRSDRRVLTRHHRTRRRWHVALPKLLGTALQFAVCALTSIGTSIS